MSAADDDRLWFEHAVVGILPDLVGTARRLATNPADAEDLAAEAIAKAWLGLGSLRDRDRFRGWIFRILTNLFISGRRARKSRPEEGPLGEDSAEFSLFGQLHQPFLLWWSNPEQEFLDKLVREDLTRAVESLPETFRVVVVLADIQGFSYH
ncbi:MAG: sigma-70 family RNA polymerase sigma factor, partial [Actinomycetota bacterium]